MIDLSPIVEAVRDHAALVAPRECCGLAQIIRGKLRYVPCRNVYSGLEDVFRIDEEDMAAAEDAGEIVAIVHSHVGLPPSPSMADRVGIEASQLPWLIVNFPTGAWTVTEPSGYRAPLIGRQWVHGVMDCYSLIRDYYRETLQIELPDYPRQELWWEKGDSLYTDLFEDAGFHVVDEKDMQPHDVILMQCRAAVSNHAAVYLGENIILQHAMHRLSSRDPWGGYWKKCATHYLRHRSLA